MTPPDPLAAGAPAQWMLEAAREWMGPLVRTASEMDAEDGDPCEPRYATALESVNRLAAMIAKHAPPATGDAEAVAEKLCAEADELEFTWEEYIDGATDASPLARRASEALHIADKIRTLAARVRLLGRQGWVTVTDDPETWPKSREGVVLMESEFGANQQARPSWNASDEFQAGAFRGYRWMPWPSSAAADASHE